MPAHTFTRRHARPEPGRRARRPQLERDTPIVALAVAWSVVEELSPISANRCPVGMSPVWRFGSTLLRALGFVSREMRRPDERGRDLLYVFMWHGLAARLDQERPALFTRLPRGFAVGEAPPVVRA
jgi:hypothetical protein